MWTASRNAPRAPRARCPLATWRRFLGSRSGLGCGFIIGYLLRVVGHEYALRQRPRMSGTCGRELRAVGANPRRADVVAMRPRVKRAACPYARPGPGRATPNGELLPGGGIAADNRRNVAASVAGSDSPDAIIISSSGPWAGETAAAEIPSRPKPSSLANSRRSGLLSIARPPPQTSSCAQSH